MVTAEEADRVSARAASRPDIDAALKPLAPGAMLRIASGAVAVDVAPKAGGRIAQITCDSVEWLAGHTAARAATIGWGSYPMLPWAGRLRRGRFRFQGQSYRLPVNLGTHAIHGVGFALPWRVDAHAANWIELSLQLPEDERWPFGGHAQQRIVVGDRQLELHLTIAADARPMPYAIGWHPWLLKPDHVEFKPIAMYPRDAEGIATRPFVDPPPPPWDDCFIQREPVIVRRAGQTLRLTSDCTHWVVYDQPADTTCIEPQTGPPDAFNLAPQTLAPGASRSAWFRWEWS
jgi:aldose 1-epimerase